MTTTQLDASRQVKDASVSDAKLASVFLKADGSVALTADLLAGNHKITGLATPTAASDAVTKSYADAAAAGIDWKASVRSATTSVGGNISLSGTQTIDGVALSAGERVLVKNQTTGSQNGIYVVASGAWSRATDADENAEVTSDLAVYVSEGSQAGQQWILSTADPIAIGTTSLTFTQFGGGTMPNAGNGLTLTGSTLDVVVGNGLSAGADIVDLVLDSTSLSKSGSGVKVASGGVTGTELNASVAGNGLAGGGGSALSVNVDASTIEINADTLRLKDAGVTSAKLGTGSRRVTRETPSGSINGSNVTFTLANTPASGMEEVYLNGILQEPGAGNDYTISGVTITYLAAPATGDRLRVNYMY